MKHKNTRSHALKAIILTLAFGVSTPLALGDAQDARVFGVTAAQLLETAKMAEGDALAYPSLNAPEMSQGFISDLQRFGISAARLSREIKEIDGPEDFQCIFRGMAKETGDQLNAISTAQTGADQADALKRLVTMLDDAVMVSEATARTFEGKAPAIDSSTIIGSCSIE